jgi:hypothetical protein
LETKGGSSWPTCSAAGSKATQACETTEGVEAALVAHATKSPGLFAGTSIIGETGKRMSTRPATRQVGTRFMLAVQTGDPPQPAQLPAGWLVELRGSPESFAVMDGLPASKIANVVHDSDSHFLTGSQVNASKDAVTAYSRAELLLETLNGLAAVIDQRYKPLSLASPVFRQNADGTRTWISSFASGVILDGNTPFSWKGRPLPVMTGGCIDLSLRDSKVRDALALFALVPRNQATLYRIFEIIASDLSSSKHEAEIRIVAQSWARREEVDLFRRSAQPGRHGATKDPRPERPMNLPDAEGFVRNLLARWISRKSEQASKADRC